MARSKDDTRRQLLDGGADLLLENGYPEAVNVRLAEVCRRLGVTTGSAYQIWRRQEDYQRDLVLHIVDEFDWGPKVVATAVDEALSAGFETPDEVIRRVGRHYFDLLTESREFFLILHLWSIRNPRPELRDALRTSYRNVHKALVEVFQGAILAFDVELIPGFSIDDMSATATAITEGMVIRHRFDPQAVRNGELYGDVLVGLFNHFTCRPD